MTEFATKELFELAPEAIVLSSLDPPRVLRANREFTRLFGYTAEELVGRSLRELIAPGELDAGYAANALSIATGRKIEREVVRQRKDGTRFHAQFAGVRVQLGEGRAGALLIYRDITEHAHARALLAGEKHLLEMIARGSSLPTILEAICRLFDELSADALSSVMLLDPASGYIRTGAAPNLPPDYRRALDALVFEGPSSGPCGLAAFQRAAVIVSDIASDPRWLNYRELPLAHGLRACWSTPFVSEAGKVLGTFAIFYRQPRAPTAQQLGLIEQFAHLASIAVERKRTEEELRESEERYARAMEASSGGLWEWNPATDAMFVSARAKESFGLAPEVDIRTRAELKARAAFHPEDLQRIEDEIQASLAERRGFDIEYRVTNRQGEVRWLRSLGKAFRKSPDAPWRMTGSLTDITERRRAELALQHSEERYALAVQAAGDGHSDWILDTGEFYVSPRLLEICGYAPGTTFKDRAQWVQRFPFHPEDRQEWERAVAAHFAGNTARFEHEARIVVRGETRWVRFVFLCSRDASGRPCRWTGSTADVTDRKCAELALRASEERYALAMQASGEGHWDWKIGTDEYYTSPRHLEILGLPPGTRSKGRAEALGRIPYHPEDRPRYDAAVADHFAGKTPRVDIQVRLMVRGELRWVHAIGMCLRDAAGVPVRWAGSVTDITEQKRAEEARRLSEERYARAMEGSDAGHWDWNIATDEMFVSERAREMLCLEPGPLPATRSEIMALVPEHAEDRRSMDEKVRASLASGMHERDYRVISASGDVRWLRSRAKVYRDESGAPSRMTGSLTDITERKLAVEALRLSEAQYARAMEAADEGHWDWNLLTDEIFLSPRYKELVGLPAHAQFGSRTEFIAQLPVIPEDRQRLLDTIQAAIRSPSPSPRYETEYRVSTPQGALRWLRSRGKVFRDEGGRVVRMSGALTDITARKEAESALRESEARFRSLTELSSDFFWETDAAHRYSAIEYGKAYRGVGESGSKIGRTRWEIPHASPDEAAWSAHRAAIAARRRFVDFGFSRVEKGKERFYEHSGEPRFDPQGRFLGYRGVGRDITERKRAQEALRLSEERYALAMQASGEGHWDWKIDTDEFYASPRYLEIGGFPPDTKASRRSDIAQRYPFHPEDRPKYQAAMAAHFAGKTPRMDIVIRSTPHGRVRWLHAIGMCSRDAEGKPVRWAGSVSDITEKKNAEQALQLSEERYALALQASAEGHFDIDLDTGALFFSARLNEIFGFAPDTQFGNWVEFMERAPIHPEDRPMVDEAHRAALAGGLVRYEFELRIVPRPGELRWLSVRSKITRDAEGKARRRTGVVTDITERKLAADVLRASEARFRSLTELSSDWYWKQDQNLRFTYLSGQVHDLTGYSGESSLGKTRWEIANMTPLSCSWPEHQAVLAARQPFRDLECCRVGPDGTIRYLSMSGTPIFDEQGRFKGYQGIGRNITERKRIEEELRSRQEMLDLAQKSAQAIAFEWRIGDGEGENRWSPDLEAMYGLAPGSYDGTYETWKKLVHRDDWPAVKEAIEHAQRTGDVASEYRVVHPEGSVHWLQAKGRMFFDREGRPTRMVGFMQDVTGQRQAQEELLRLERRLRQAQRLEAMGTLAGGIAHDFNNILGAVLGYGEMALRDAPKGSRQRRDLEAIMSAGERGRALVDRVLAFSRSGVGERVAVHVEAVVREALDLIAGSLPPNVRIEADLRAGRSAMLGDPTQVHQVLMNLATNAVQAMSAGGTLRVSLETLALDAPRLATVGSVPAGELIVLAVADTGTGIAPEMLERIFDPFFTTKEIGTGTGLGLSLVHGIVAEVGGAVDVVSRPGEGSVFTVYLPRAGEASDQRPEETAAMPRGAHQRILVVDDEEPLVRLATQTLAELGYEPLGYTSSAAALEAFRADPQRFDALITDERMPGMTGSALIREVRGIRQGIPIVLMSGFVGGGVLGRAREAGADEVLKKPLKARELATSLARVLQP